MCSSDCFLAVLAILFPPLAVWVKCGLCSADSLINILLCMLGFIPGLLHAWYIIAKFPEESYDYQRVSQDAEGGRVTYVFVQGNGGPQQQQQQQQRRQPQSVQPKPQDQGVMNYGATNQSGGAAHGGSSSVAAGSSSAGNNAPPTYAEAVKGDNKIQTQD
ncbi:Plasma membrane proteolipid [Apiospora hydei]|uniref:Plasma membrane proteolipid n=1 Tax=Apiospora hydei TaxID=1337664 RepID=A0ABR1W8G1_9PEZI